MKEKIFTTMESKGESKCIACDYPKDPPDWHDYQCPKCGCPQGFLVYPEDKEKFWEKRWPELKKHYQEMAKIRQQSFPV